MTNRTWAGTCGAIVAAASIAVLAQTQPPPAPQTSAASPDQVTVTGCLKPAPAVAPDAGATGTAGTTGTTGTSGTTAVAPTDADAKFLLTNATVAPAAPPSEPSASASTTAAAAGSQASADQKTYRLIANAGALSPHVGKKLELTGTLVNASDPTANAAAGSPANAPALRVEKGKIIAASCEE